MTQEKGMMKKLVLAGNPNAGKSVFFNYLTGIYVDVSNYPGTTLDITKGQYKHYEVYDTPGVYGISSFNDEERVAKDVILEADIILNVVNAVYLERDLFLTMQLIDTGIPVIVALNMLDEAKKKKIEIDVEKLSAQLGVPILTTIATKKIGLKDIVEHLDTAHIGISDIGLQRDLGEVRQKYPQLSQGEALLYLEGDLPITEKYSLSLNDHKKEIYRKRRERVNNILKEAISFDPKSSHFNHKLSRLLINPVTGLPILAFMLFLMYKVIGQFVAGTVVDFTEGTLMVGYYEPFIRYVMGHFMNLNSLLGQILTGEFGLLTMTFTYVLGLLLPLVFGFYFFLSLFEDSGYLPRIATLTDNILNKIGLNGRAIIPLILGFGCVTVATITTRLLGSEREKRIAIFLLGLAIPCSAQLGIITGMLTTLSPRFIMLYIIVILTVLVLTGTLLNMLLPGKSSTLFIDLPPLRLPQIKNVMTKTVTKSWQFILEAIPLFGLGALLISVLQITGALDLLQKSMAPLTVSWLGLPKESANAFIMGMIRRDFGAIGLLKMQLSQLQIVVSIVTITLFVPCIATVMVMFKERSRKEALMMWLGTWVIAFIIGGIVNNLAAFIGDDTGLKIGLVILTFIALGALLLGLAKLFVKKRDPHMENIYEDIPISCSQHACSGSCLSCASRKKAQ
jgi:ferrous iron transport protein B